MTTWRHSKRSNILLAVALGLIAAGCLAVGGYVFSLVPVIGGPDESLIFWLLPFLFFGLAAAGMGIVLAVLWLLLVSTDGNRGEGEN